MTIQFPFSQQELADFLKTSELAISSKLDDEQKRFLQYIEEHGANIRVSKEGWRDPILPEFFCELAKLRGADTIPSFQIIDEVVMVES